MATTTRSARQQWLVGALILLSAFNATLGGLAAGRNIELSESTQMLWYLIFSVVIGVWLKNDIADRGSETSRNYPDFLIFLLWPLLLPYHLLGSRGIEGLVLFVGYIAPYMAPYIVQLIVWLEHAG